MLNRFPQYYQILASILATFLDDLAGVQIGAASAWRRISLHSALANWQFPE
jgi:hypothetical protein